MILNDKDSSDEDFGGPQETINDKDSDDEDIGGPRRDTKQ